MSNLDYMYAFSCVVIFVFAYSQQSPPLGQQTSPSTCVPTCDKICENCVGKRCYDNETCVDGCIPNWTGPKCTEKEPKQSQSDLDSGGSTYAIVCLVFLTLLAIVTFSLVYVKKRTPKDNDGDFTGTRTYPFRNQGIFPESVACEVKPPVQILEPSPKTPGNKSGRSNEESEAEGDAVDEDTGQRVSKA